MTREADIAIIGSGAAGIAAARRLAGAGLSAVILEASSRVGGRAWTREVNSMPLDLGCGWLHSADRNPWTRIAEESGFLVNRRRAAWGAQYRDLGFPAVEQAASDHAFGRWNSRLIKTPPESDCAADALLEADAKWTPYLQAISGYLNGDELERISVRDYLAYDTASTDINWRIEAGYGALVAASLPAEVDLRLSTPVEAVSLEGRQIALRTGAGALRVSAAIVTVSTNVLAGDTITWPSALDPWREAARRLPLGANEKLFIEIIGDSPFAPESHVLGDPHDAETGTYYIRPFGRPVIECFLGGAGAQAASRDGDLTAFSRAIEQLVRLFGPSVRAHLKPLIASDWTNTPTIGGAYSHALPGQSDSRRILARPYDNRLFFAGEATHLTDFSTAHGAYQSGVRAAEEAIQALTARPSTTSRAHEQAGGT